MVTVTVNSNDWKAAEEGYAGAHPLAEKLDSTVHETELAEMAQVAVDMLCIIQLRRDVLDHGDTPEDEMIQFQQELWELVHKFIPNLNP